jgi:hypothetical protein
LVASAGVKINSVVPLIVAPLALEVPEIAPILLNPAFEAVMEAFTYSVVAIFVELSLVNGVGAVGVPVNVGDAIGAFVKISAVLVVILDVLVFILVSNDEIVEELTPPTLFIVVAKLPFPLPVTSPVKVVVAAADMTSVPITSPKFALAPAAVVAPVPPFATATVVPLHVPEVIVPTVFKFDKDVNVVLAVAVIFPAVVAVVALPKKFVAETSLLNVFAPAIVCVPVEINPGLFASAAVNVKNVPLIVPPFVALVLEYVNEETPLTAGAEETQFVPSEVKIFPDAPGLVNPVPPLATLIVVPLQVPEAIVPKVQPVVPSCWARTVPCPSDRMILLFKLAPIVPDWAPMIVL